MTTPSTKTTTTAKKTAIFAGSALLIAGGAISYLQVYRSNFSAVNRAPAQVSTDNALYTSKPTSQTAETTLRALRLKAEQEKQLGKEGDREATMRQAVDAASAGYNPMHKEVADCLDDLGKLLTDKNKFAEALPYLERGYDIRNKGEVEYCDKNAYTGSLLAECLMNLKNYSEADALYRRIIDFYRHSDQGGFSEGQQRAVENLANSLRWQERYKEALALEEEEISTLENLQKTRPGASILMASAYTAAADTAQDSGNLSLSKKYLGLALTTLSAVPQSSAQNYGRTRAEVFGQLADIYHELKSPIDEMAAREKCEANYQFQAAFLDDDDKGERAENLMKAGACAILLKDPVLASDFYQKALDQSNKDAVVRAKLLEHKDWLKYFLTASKSKAFKSNSNVKEVATQIKELLPG